MSKATEECYCPPTPSNVPTPGCPVHDPAQPSEAPREPETWSAMLSRHVKEVAAWPGTLYIGSAPRPEATEIIDGVRGLFIDADEVPDVVMCNGERFTPDTQPSEDDAFEMCRSPDWRAFVDDNGVPTCGPEKTDHLGCHHCLGPLDAKPRTGEYECPWCIARYPEVAQPSEAQIDRDALFTGIWAGYVGPHDDMDDCPLWYDGCSCPPKSEAPLREALEWAMDLIDMYDERLASIDGREKVYTAVHIAGKHQARTALTAHRTPPEGE